MGEAKVEWKETSKRRNEQTGKDENETLDMNGHEEYFQISYYLKGGVNSGEIELPAGAHTFPFTCALPPQLPCSFEGEYGYIRYTIKVTLERPWKFDQDTKMAFTVISPVDLNQMEKAREPFKLAMDKTFCCWCCASKPLSIIVSIPVTGYVSGQTIPILAEIDNQSNVDVEKVKFQFRKHLAFHTSAPRTTKKDVKVIGELALGPYAKGEQKTIRQTLEIPALPASNLLNCGIIDLHYDLSVVCEVSGFHTNLDGVIPITIGTVPLKDFTPQQSASQQQFDISMMPTHPISSPDATGGAIGWTNGDGNSLYPNIPPPTFNEGDFHASSIKDKEDSEHTRLVGNQETFAPRYPVFNYQHRAPTAPMD